MLIKEIAILKETSDDHADHTAVIRDYFMNGKIFKALMYMDEHDLTIADNPGIASIVKANAAAIGKTAVDFMCKSDDPYTELSQFGLTLDEIGLVLPNRGVAKGMMAEKQRMESYLNELATKSYDDFWTSLLVADLLATQYDVMIGEFFDAEDEKPFIIKTIIAKLKQKRNSWEVSKVLSVLRSWNINWPEIGAIQNAISSATRPPRTESVNAQPIMESAVFLNDETVIVGQEHGHPPKLSAETLKKVQDIAAKHGAWYEGNGGDRAYTKGIIDSYKGSWDNIVNDQIKGYPPEFLYTLFSNVDANDRINKIGADPKVSIFDRIMATRKDNYFADRVFDEKTLTKFLHQVSQEGYDFLEMSKQPATKQNLTRFLKTGEKLMWPSNWETYPNPAGKVANKANKVRDNWLVNAPPGVYIAGSGHLVGVSKISGKREVP